MRILITGLSGFAGKHLIEYLSLDESHVFFGIDLKECSKGLDIRNSELVEKKVDLTDREEVEKIIKEYKIVNQ